MYLNTYIPTINTEILPCLDTPETSPGQQHDFETYDLMTENKEVLTFQEKLLRVAGPSPPFHEFLPLRLRQNNHNSVKRKLKISSLAPPNLA